MAVDVPKHPTDSQRIPEVTAELAEAALWAAETGVYVYRAP